MEQTQPTMVILKLTMYLIPCHSSLLRLNFFDSKHSGIWKLARDTRREHTRLSTEVISSTFSPVLINNIYHGFIET